MNPDGCSDIEEAYATSSSWIPLEAATIQRWRVAPEQFRKQNIR